MELKSKKTPLTQAVMQDNADALMDILRGGTDINEFSYFRGHGETPLLTAVRYARENMVLLLLSHGADVNLPSTKGHTPLLRASQRNYFNMVCLLLKHNADPNAMDNSGKTALFWAVKLRNFNSTKELLEHGASVNIMNSNRKRATVLHIAVNVDYNKVTRYLLDAGADVSAIDEFGDTPLFYGVRVDNMDMVELLLEKGANVNAFNQDYRTPLHICAASVHNNVDLTQLLLDHNASIIAKDRYGNTPLVLSLRNYILRQNYSVARCLIQHGSQLRDEEVVSALEWTVQAHANFKIVKYAIEAGFPLQRVPWVKDLLNGDNNQRPSFVSRYDSEEKTQFIQYIRYKLTIPASLAEIARVTIRQVIVDSGYEFSIFGCIRQLPLPQAIQLFIMMEEG